MVTMTDQTTPDTENNGTQEWVPITEAARRIGVSHPKLSRLVKGGRIESRLNPFDDRQTLVNMEELKLYFKKP